MNNMTQLLNMIKNGGINSNQMILSYLEQNSQGNPMLFNLIQLAKNNQIGEIEKIARNIVTSQGADFDKEFYNFKKNLGL